MTDHLSSLALDEAAVELPLEDSARAHLDGCGQCQAALAERRALNARLLADPRAQALKARLLGGAPASSPAPAAARARPARRWVLAAVPLAAALAVFLTVALRRPDGGGDRVKGAPTVELMQDGRPVRRAPVGARLRVAIGAAGHGFAAVLAVDPASGALEPLWPAAGAMAAAPTGARTPVGPELEVTPGDTRVVAVFADTAASAADAKAAAASQVHGRPLPAGFVAAEVALEVSPP